MANSIDAVKQLQKEIDVFTGQLNDINDKIITISKNTRAVSDGFSKIKTPSGVNSALKETSGNIEQVNALYKQQDSLEKNLINTQAKKKLAIESTNKALIKERFELQQQNKLVKEAVILSSRYSTELQKATAQRNKLARTIQDLNVKRNLGNKLSDKEQKELKQSTAQFEKYDKAIKKAKTSVGRFQENVGNYPKMLGSIKSLATGLIGAFGIVEGLRLSFDFASEAVQLARDAKGVEFAFKDLGFEGVNAFERIKESTRGALSDLDIKKSLNEFKNFNISLEQTDVLFEFLAVRAAQTGKSVDSLRDSLVEGLAKESKLRIDNLGISVKDLNSELEKAPDFVSAVANIARTEIAEAGGILDDTTSSQVKFNVAFENFKLSAGSGFLGKLSNSFYSLGLSVAAASTEISDASDNLFEFGINALLAATGQSKLVKQRAEENRETKKRSDSLKEINKLMKERGIEEDKAFNIGTRLSQLTTENIEKVLDSERRMAAAIDKQKKSTDDNNESRKKAIDILSDLSTLENDVLKDGPQLTNTEDFELKGIEVVGIDKDKLEQDVEEIQANLALIEKWAKEAQVDEIIRGGLNDLAGTIEEFTGVSGDKFLDFFDKISESGEKSFTDLADIAASSFSLAGDVSNAFFQGKIDSYQEDIDANNEYYANLLDNENLSDEERDRLETDRRRKEAQLKKKQAKEKEKQFQINKVFRIGEIIADTALSIVKIGAQLGVAALPFQIQAGVIGAAQLAIVAAQQPPKFAEGGVMGYDGKMMINDHSSGRLEVVERDGKLLMTDKKNAIVDGKKGDIIHKDAEAYFNNQSDEDLIKNLENHSILASMQNNNFLANKLESKKSADNNSYNTDRIVKAIKSQKTKFNVNQNITLADDLSFLGRINDTL